MRKTISIIALLILTGCDYETTSEQNEALMRIGGAMIGGSSQGYGAAMEAATNEYGRIKDASRQAQ